MLQKYDFAKGKYTRFPNKVMEDLIGCRCLNATELKIVLLVIRKTWGYNKDMDGISLSQMQKYLFVSRPTAAKAIGRLLRTNILILCGKGNSKVLFNIYRFNFESETWQLDKKIKLVKPLIETGKQTPEQQVNKPLHTKDKAKEKDTKNSGFEYLLENQTLKEEVAKVGHHTPDSPAGKIRMAEIVSALAQKKSIRNPLGLAISIARGRDSSKERK